MKTARLIVADSEHDANMLYAVGVFVPDPFIFLEIDGRKYAVLSDLEIDRVRKLGTVDRVLSFTRCQNALRRAGVASPQLSDVLRRVLADRRVATVEVPDNFPIGLARKLRGIRVVARPAPFFPARAVKTPAEVRRVVDALHLSEEGMGAALDVLRMSRIGRDGCLYWRGDKLTAEHVGGVINATIAGLGGTASHTIVACGHQGLDPHEEGHGPLQAHQPIILDIFPRDTRTGYWGDMTRTVVRGRTSERIQRMYAVVQQAQELAFEKLHDGVEGREVHDAIHALFRHHGFTTGRRQGRMQGFFHGTGHGLGLEIHEAPRLSAAARRLQSGNVVTVEPGLYYAGAGGVRLEDVVLIQNHSVRLLTRFPKSLEI